MSRGEVTLGAFLFIVFANEPLINHVIILSEFPRRSTTHIKGNLFLIDRKLINKYRLLSSKLPR